MVAQKLTETLTETLRESGLEETEIKVLVFLLQHDTGFKATEIARRARLNRTTLYGVLKSLADKGLVSSSDTRGVMLFQSIQPHLLVDYLERSRDRIAQNIKKVEKLIPAIVDARSGEERYRPTIKFFDGKEGIKQVYENVLVESVEKKVYGFIGAEALFKLFDEDFVDYYLKKRAAKGVRWFTHATDSAESRRLVRRDAVELRDTKLLPQNYAFDIELASYDDTTIIISYAEDHPLGIVIEDKKIAETIKAIFRYVNDTLPAKNPTER